MSRFHIVLGESVFDDCLRRIYDFLRFSLHEFAQDLFLSFLPRRSRFFYFLVARLKVYLV